MASVDYSPQPHVSTDAVPRLCPACGQRAPVQHYVRPITRKRRVKFGAIWVFLTLITLGWAVLGYLMWPRRTETIGVDRWNQCMFCKTVLS